MRSETNLELAEKIKRIALDAPSEDKAILEEGAGRLTGERLGIVAGIETKLAELIVVITGAPHGEELRIDAIFSGEFSEGDLPIYYQQPRLNLVAADDVTDDPVDHLRIEDDDQGLIGPAGDHDLTPVRPDPAGVSGSLEEAYGVKTDAA